MRIIKHLINTRINRKGWQHKRTASDGLRGEQDLCKREDEEEEGAAKRSEEDELNDE